MAVTIFISHSSKDRAVAAALVESLEAALNVAPDAIRCTSVRGHSIAVGDKSPEKLRTDLTESLVVIGLLSPASRKSEWVSMELGAAWGLQKQPLFVCLPGATFRRIPEPFQGIHAVDCDANGIADLLSRVADAAHLARKNADLDPQIRQLLTAARGPRRRRRRAATACVLLLGILAFLGIARIHRPLPRIVPQFDVQTFLPMQDGFGVSCEAEDNALRMEVWARSDAMAAYGGCCVEGNRSVNLTEYRALSVNLMVDRPSDQFEVKLESGPSGPSSLQSYLFRKPFQNVGPYHSEEYAIGDEAKKRTPTIERICFVVVGGGTRYKNTIRIRAANLLRMAAEAPRE